MSAALAQPATKSATVVNLQSLTLKNFKGIESFTLEANGQDISLFGRNGTGKTTCADALSWLLFGKDTSNRADFEVKQLLPDGDTVHRLQHEVEAVLEVDGKTLTLRKVYEEDWKTVRGTVGQAFTSHTNSYFINGVSTQAGQFKEKINQIAPEDILRIAIDPHHFNRNLTWQKRREILLDICGDVSDSEVIASNHDLALLPGILEGRSIDDHKKVAAAKKKEVKTSIETLPGRIDEARRAMPVVDATKAEIEAKATMLQGERQKLQEELGRIDNGGQIAELRRQIADINAEIAVLKSDIATKTAEAQRKEQQKLNELAAEAEPHRRTVNRLVGEIQDADSRVTRLETSLATLRAEYDAIKLETFQPVGIAETCAACGQDLPADQVEAAKQKAQEAFNLSIATKKEANQTAGRKTKGDLEGAKADSEALNAKLAEARAALASAEEAVKVEQARLSEAKTQTPAPASSPEIDALLTKRETAEEDIRKLQEGSAEARDQVNAKIVNTDHKIRANESDRLSLETREKQLKRVEELKDSETALAQAFEQAERELFMCEEFVRTKASLLTDRINSKFKLVKFKLFETQVNGGISETAVCTIDGVPYDGNLNTGNKVLAGLDILNTLSEHYGITACCFVDNAESVTSDFHTAGQQIRLYASRPDASLRIETTPL